MRCHVLPPHVLHSVAQEGTPSQRRVALATLAADQTARLGRATQQLLPPAAKTPSVAGITGCAPVLRRTIYDARRSRLMPGEVVGGEGSSFSDDAAREAFDGLGATHDFFARIYGRNSIDDEGMPLDATVHYGVRYDNAFWNGEAMVFGDGDGELFNRFTASLDVIAHELAHGVTGDEANLIYVGQSGALNESVSDVFASLVKQYARGEEASVADWLIGAELLMPGVRGVALRSMARPGTAYDDPVLGKDPQPSTMSAYVHTEQDNGGVHVNSGIPNRAFYLASIKIGGFAWERAGRIWYETIRGKALKQTATFRQFAQRTAIVAGHLYGSGSPERKAVTEAWAEVDLRV